MKKPILILTLIVGIAIAAYAQVISFSTLNPEKSDGGVYSAKTLAALAAIAGDGSTLATFGSINTVNASTATPTALGLNTVKFSTITLVGNKSPGVNNAGIVYIMTSGSSQIPINPGEKITWTAPPGKIADASCFLVKVTVANDGVDCQYSK